jgi:hypothetical protein
MENIEELLREAFRAGMNKGSHQSYFDVPLDETEYIDSIKDKLKLFFIPVVVSMCCDETRKVNQFLKRPSKYCMTCSKELN